MNNEFWKLLQSEVAIIGVASFTRRLGILSTPVALFVLRLFITILTSNFLANRT